MNCETCKKEFEPNDTIFTIDGNQEVCYDCAQAAAKKAHEEEREIEILDPNCEEHFLCIWCEDLFPKSELRKEVNMGYLCDTCIQAICNRHSLRYWLRLPGVRAGGRKYGRSRADRDPL